MLEICNKNAITQSLLDLASGMQQDIGVCTKVVLTCVPSAESIIDKEAKVEKKKSRRRAKCISLMTGYRTDKK